MNRYLTIIVFIIVGYFIGAKFPGFARSLGL